MSYNQCWLNYHKVNNYADADLLQVLTLCGDMSSPKGAIIENAMKELTLALNKMLGIRLECDTKQPFGSTEAQTNSIILVLSSRDDLNDRWDISDLGEEGYLLCEEHSNIYIVGRTEVSILYGCFELLRRVAMGEALRGLMLKQKPMNPLRMLNHWDNPDGSIERGYSGKSFFFDKDELLINERTVDYARLVASIGINAVVINNVNVHTGAATGLITDRYLDKLEEMNRIFSGYGIKLFLSANFAAPMELGGIETADPCDSKVEGWWKSCVANIYRRIPDFGGFLIKADSEGRPGPFTYGRTHADGANLLARALKSYSGILIWRCFVYNCQQDWRDYKTDRARAAYDNFMSLDGLFEDNVILQIKNGPMDFQVREPVSPLFGGLKRTNQMLEVQIAQEYTGQQKHVCYLLPMWKEVLGFQTYAEANRATVADIVAGRTYQQINCGMAAVANTGNDYNWTGHELAAANLYGFGRLCWNTELSSEEIAREWILLTYEHNEEVLNTLSDILLGSWSTYEKYTSPLGIGWMVNPHTHYGPNVDGYEYDKWGTYHRADRNGVGVDRTVNGTGYVSQYNEPIASEYNGLESCPEELLLFFHHVSYDHKLRSGKTLIQHIYDTHFEGVDEVENMLQRLQRIQEHLPRDVYKRMLERFEEQLESAKEWRDRVNTYFYRKSGVDDEQHRKIYY
jgi:alpha-glucuronidase